MAGHSEDLGTAHVGVEVELNQETMNRALREMEGGLDSLGTAVTRLSDRFTRTGVTIQRALSSGNTTALGNLSRALLGSGRAFQQVEVQSRAATDHMVEAGNAAKDYGDALAAAAEEAKRFTGGDSRGMSAWIRELQVGANTYRELVELSKEYHETSSMMLVDAGRETQAVGELSNKLREVGLLLRDVDAVRRSIGQTTSGGNLLPPRGDATLNWMMGLRGLQQAEQHAQRYVQARNQSLMPDEPVRRPQGLMGAIREVQVGRPEMVESKDYFGPKLIGSQVIRQGGTGAVHILESGRPGEVDGVRGPNHPGSLINPVNVAVTDGILAGLGTRAQRFITPPSDSHEAPAGTAVAGSTTGASTNPQHIAVVHGLALAQQQLAMGLPVAPQSFRRQLQGSSRATDVTHYIDEMVQKIDEGRLLPAPRDPYRRRFEPVDPYPKYQYTIGNMGTTNPANLYAEGGPRRFIGWRDQPMPPGAPSHSYYDPNALAATGPYMGQILRQHWDQTGRGEFPGTGAALQQMGIPRGARMRDLTKGGDFASFTRPANAVTSAGLGIPSLALLSQLRQPTEEDRAQTARLEEISHNTRLQYQLEQARLVHESEGQIYAGPARGGRRPIPQQGGVRGSGSGLMREWLQSVDKLVREIEQSKSIHPETAAARIAELRSATPPQWASAPGSSGLAGSAQRALSQSAEEYARRIATTEAEVVERASRDAAARELAQHNREATTKLYRQGLRSGDFAGLPRESDPTWQGYQRSPRRLGGARQWPMQPSAQDVLDYIDTHLGHVSGAERTHQALTSARERVRLPRSRAGRGTQALSLAEVQHNLMGQLAGLLSQGHAAGLLGAQPVKVEIAGKSVKELGSGIADAEAEKRHIEDARAVQELKEFRAAHQQGAEMFQVGPNEPRVGSLGTLGSTLEETMRQVQGGTLAKFIQSGVEPDLLRSLELKGKPKGGGLSSILSLNKTIQEQTDTEHVDATKAAAQLEKVAQNTEQVARNSRELPLIRDDIEQTGNFLSPLAAAAAAQALGGGGGGGGARPGLPMGGGGRGEPSGADWMHLIDTWDQVGRQIGSPHGLLAEQAMADQAAARTLYPSHRGPGARTLGGPSPYANVGTGGQDRFLSRQQEEQAIRDAFYMEQAYNRAAGAGHGGGGGRPPRGALGAGPPPDPGFRRGMGGPLDFYRGRPGTDLIRHPTLFGGGTHAQHDVRDTESSAGFLRGMFTGLGNAARDARDRLGQFGASLRSEVKDRGGAGAILGAGLAGVAGGARSDMGRNILWGGGAGGGGGGSMFLPWFLRGLTAPGVGAGFGSLGSFAGLGHEHAAMTMMGIAGSAGTAVAGAGTLAAGSAASMLVGGGSDLAVGATTLAQTKALHQAYDNLNQQVDMYGKHSAQAAAAQKAVNAQLKLTAADVGPQAAKAEGQLAQSVGQMEAHWLRGTAGAQVQSTKVFGQAIKLADDYVSHINSAATQNLAIINKDIKPLFSWLEGPQGIGVFNNLERNFKRNLPDAIGAFSQGIEVMMRFVSAASDHTGGFVHHLDQLFTRLNDRSSSFFDMRVQAWINDFHIWKDFTVELAHVLHDMFTQDAQTGQGVIQALTGMLKKLDEWEKTTKGSGQMHNLFEIHKAQVLELLQVFEGLAKVFGSFYLQVAPQLTAAMVGIIGAIAGIAGEATHLGPVITDLTAFALLGAKFHFLGPMLRGIGSALGLIGAKKSETAAASEQTKILAGATEQYTGIIEENTVAMKANIAMLRALFTAQKEAGGAAEGNAAKFDAETGAIIGNSTATEGNAAAATADAAAKKAEASATGLSTDANLVNVESQGGSGLMSALSGSRFNPKNMWNSLRGRGAKLGGASEQVVASTIAGEAVPASEGALAKLGSMALPALMGGGIGFIGGQLVTQATGAHGALGGAITGGMTGAGIGTAIAPGIGTAVGAALGAAVGAVMNGMFSSKAGENYGKEFSQGWVKAIGRNALTASIGPHFAKQEEQAMTATYNRVKRLQQQLTQLQSPQRQPGGSRLGALLPIPTAADIQSAKTKLQAAEVQLGRETGRAYVQSIQRVRFPTEPLMVRDFQRKLKELPPFARASAAEAMVQYAAALEKNGKLPMGSTNKIIKQLEGQFPGLTDAFKSAGTSSDQQLAAGLALGQSQQALANAVNQINLQLNVLGQNVTTTSQDSTQNAIKSYQILKQTLPGLTGTARQLVLADMDRLKSGIKTNLQAQLAGLAVHDTQWKEEIRKGTKGATGAALGGLTAYQNLVHDAMQSGLTLTGQGNALISQAMSNWSKAMGGNKFATPTVKAGSGTVPAPNPLSFGNIGGKAQGGMVTVGQEGARGPDVVPMRVGRTDIAVGEGEKVAVFNHSQQAVMDHRLADFGGLNGFFARVNGRHAGGGLVAGSGGPAMFTFGGVLGGGTFGLNAGLNSTYSEASGPSGPKLPYSAIEQVWVMAGGPASVAPTAAAIAEAESWGGEPGAVQQGQPYATTGWGLWQITPGNSESQFGTDRQLLDPMNNAKAAVAKFRGAGDSFRPWTTYNDGAYRAYMHGGNTPANLRGGSFTAPNLQPPQVVQPQGLIGNEGQAAIDRDTQVANQYLSQTVAAANAPIGRGGGGAPGTSSQVPISNPRLTRLESNMLHAASSIVGLPYIFGGGHGGWNAPGYDCSGAVSYVLHAGNLISSPETTSGLVGWGDPGPGKYVTVAVHETGDPHLSHTMMSFFGRYFESGGGPRGPHWDSGWDPYALGTLRHPRGLATGGGGDYGRVDALTLATNQPALVTSKDFMSYATAQGYTPAAVAHAASVSLPKLPKARLPKAHQPKVKGHIPKGSLNLLRPMRGLPKKVNLAILDYNRVVRHIQQLGNLGGSLSNSQSQVPTEAIVTMLSGQEVINWGNPPNLTMRDPGTNIDEYGVYTMLEQQVHGSGKAPGWTPNYGDQSNTSQWGVDSQMLRSYEKEVQDAMLIKLELERWFGDKTLSDQGIADVTHTWPYKDLVKIKKQLEVGLPDDEAQDKFELTKIYDNAKTHEEELFLRKEVGLAEWLNRMTAYVSNWESASNAGLSGLKGQSAGERAFVQSQITQWGTMKDLGYRNTRLERELGNSISHAERQKALRLWHEEQVTGIDKYYRQRKFKERQVVQEGEAVFQAFNSIVSPNGMWESISSDAAAYPILDMYLEKELGYSTKGLGKAGLLSKGKTGTTGLDSKGNAPVSAFGDLGSTISSLGQDMDQIKINVGNLKNTFIPPSGSNYQALLQTLESQLQLADLQDSVLSSEMGAITDFLSNNPGGIPPFGGSFAEGGIVPGPAGEPRTIIAHGGEAIGQMGGPSTSTVQVAVIVEDGAVDKGKIKAVAQQVWNENGRSTSSTARRGLPSRGGR